MINFMLTVACIVIVIVIVSTTTIGDIYAQDINTTNTVRYNNSAIIKKLNANIIDAINVKIGSVYGEDGWNYTNSAMAIITKVKHG